VTGGARSPFPSASGLSRSLTSIDIGIIAERVTQSRTGAIFSFSRAKVGKQEHGGMGQNECNSPRGRPAHGRRAPTHGGETEHFSCRVEARSELTSYDVVLNRILVLGRRMRTTRRGRRKHSRSRRYAVEGCRDASLAAGAGCRESTVRSYALCMPGIRRMGAICRSREMAGVQS